MTDEDALLHAICADPADDTARLVFADFLQECGGNVATAWAFFIRGQIELARLASGTAEATVARVRLLDVPFWHTQWIARLGFAERKLTWDSWVRGFPRHLSGASTELRQVWPQLSMRVPFESLTLSSASDADVEELLTRPEIGRVRELALTTDHHGQQLGDRAFLALAACKHLRNLKGLRMLSAVLTNRGAKALLDSPHLGELTTVHVSAWYSHRKSTVTSTVRERLQRRFPVFTLY